MLNYAKISKETIGLLYQCHASLKNSPLKATIRVLAEVRVSEINSCAYCLGLHSEEALKLGVEQEKLDALSTWRLSPLFSEEERVALQWVESVTSLDESLSVAKEELFKAFSEREVVDLTTCISIMNALNRIAICLRN